MISPAGRGPSGPAATWVRYRFVFLVLAPIMALFLYLRVVPTGPGAR